MLDETAASPRESVGSTESRAIARTDCPECGERLVHRGGCVDCGACGYSTCG